MKVNEYIKYDAIALAALIRSKAVSPEEVLNAAIARYESVNPELNAVVHTFFDKAREALSQADSKAPLYGVPFLLKDLSLYYAGEPTTEGSLLFKRYIPDHDSELVRRYKQAGLIIMGKTNTPEFGANWVTESTLLGPCRNPYDHTRTPGGSSGGSAAAVASGIVPVAHASDGGGSIRVPASCCGLIGLKPSRGRVSLAPDRGESAAGLSSHHVLTRSVRDCALLLDLTHGFVAGDPYAAPPAPTSYLELLEQPPHSLRIGMVTQAPGGFPVDPACLKALFFAAQQLEDHGHVIEETVLPDDPAWNQAVMRIWMAQLAQAVSVYSRATGCDYRDRVEPANLHMIERGLALPASEYVSAIKTMHQAGRRVAALFERYDILLTPTLAQPPVAIGALAYDVAKGPVEDFFYKYGYGFSPFTTLFNMSGHPALSLPLHKNESGLPIGVQFVAPFGGEQRLLCLGASLGL